MKPNRSPLIAYRDTFARNFLKVYHMATDEERTQGMQWYPAMHALVTHWAQAAERSVENIAALLAVLSPQCDWDNNKRAAHEFLMDGNLQTYAGGILMHSVMCAHRVMDEHIEDTREVMPGGPKVYHFSRNLAGDYSVPTIDTHMIEAAWFDASRISHGPAWAAYAAIADALTLAADEVGLAPAHFQAVVWVTWKRLFPRVNKRELRRAA